MTRKEQEEKIRNKKKDLQEWDLRKIEEANKQSNL